MLQNYGAVTQAFIGTLFTWGLTAAGAGMVVMFKGTQVRIVVYNIM
jgi:zinc transporter 11